MSLTPDPYLLRLHRVDSSELEDNRTVHVQGEPDLDRLAADPDERMESIPRPHPCAAVINWLIVVGCAAAISLVSIPELREAIAHVLR